MKKSYRKLKKDAKGRIEEIGEGTVTLELPLPAAEVLLGMREAVEDVVRGAGLLVVEALMADEGWRKAGFKNRKDPERQANWWGSQAGSVVLFGKTVPVKKPRIRARKGGEVRLDAYERLRRRDRMEWPVFEKMVRGVSTRDYEGAAEGFLEGVGVKKSNVSRHFVAATAKRMRELLERDLSGLGLCALFVDGVDFQGHMLVVALGLNVDGKKHVLGLWEGATENAQTCLELFDDLVRRGLDAEGEYLFILDGSKALRSAVERRFGKKTAVQRCQFHKRENVRSQLPPEVQNAIDARIRSAYNMADYEAAKTSLELTVRHLERINPSAAASLREGLEETLTVHRLGVSHDLRRTLSSTNPIESMFSRVRQTTGRVKRWRRGESKMVQRWAAAAMLKAEQSFRRVKGYRELPKLVEALKKKTLVKEKSAA